MSIPRTMPGTDTKVTPEIDAPIMPKETIYQGDLFSPLKNAAFDPPLCQICANPQRDASTVCVVENIRDVMAVEATQQYRGLYHVLGGVISPMDGVGPSDLQIESLVQRVSEGGIKEVILALSTTMEGDTTNFYIYRKLEKMGVKLSVIARGISVGDELEYADEITLGRSIVNRTLFTGTV